LQFTALPSINSATHSSPQFVRYTLVY